MGPPRGVINRFLISFSPRQRLRSGVELRDQRIFNDSRCYGRHGRCYALIAKNIYDPTPLKTFYSYTFVRREEVLLSGRTYTDVLWTKTCRNLGLSECLGVMRTRDDEDDDG